MVAMRGRVLPWCLFLTVCVGLELSGDLSSCLAAPADPAALRAPRTRPKRAPAARPNGFSAEVRLSESPSEQELCRCRVFEEGLVPVGGSPSPAENRALARALQAFLDRSSSEDFSALTGFLDIYPQTVWRAALLLNLGNEFYAQARYSRALEAWEQAWADSKSAVAPSAVALANRALGELVKMHARIGRFERLEELFREIEGREITGAATERIAGARQGLWSMRNEPWRAFRCGPMALDRIRKFLNPQDVGDNRLQESKSTQQGFPLDQLCELSKSIGMGYQMARRRPGARVVLPSVVHWKIGHYAALIREEGGKFLLQDPTFGNDAWISAAALDSEASGHFLIPPGSLLPGWSSITAEEARTVWGKGETSDNDDDHTTDDDEKGKDDCDSQGLATYNFHLMLVSLNITDVPVGYTPPVGPSVNFKVTYNQREANQPANFSYSNLGNKWTFDWLAYLSDSPSSPSADVRYFVEGGGTETFSGFNAGTRAFTPQWRNQAVLERTGAASYKMRFPDGSIKIFDHASGAGTGRRVFLSQIIDPHGNTLDLNYDEFFRLVEVVDAIGQATVLSYDLPDDIYKITRVSDPFGRTAKFEYANGRLLKITDVIGLISEFTYGPGDFINRLRTPYGDTTFDYGEIGRTRWLEIVDPQGEKERVEFNERRDTGLPYSEPLVPSGIITRNSVLTARNTFYWDKKAMQEAPGDYLKARLYHWLHSANWSSAIGVLQCRKEPLEGRVWFTYPGQLGGVSGATLPGTSDLPDKVARLLDDGTTQLYQYERNSLGKVTKSVDPVGRTMTYAYSPDGIDLLEIRQSTGTNNDLIGKFVYNAQHRPILVTDAAGQTTTNTYNARGQLLRTSNPLGQTRAFTYDPNGYLLAIDGPLPGTGDTTRFAYDPVGRIRTLTEVGGYTRSFVYDDLDRLTRTTFPDGTSESYDYDKLDRVLSRDRMGRETHHTYDALRRLIATRDPLNRTNRFDYCGCGALSALTDAMGRTTRWHYDVQGRLAAKEYVDGSRITYAYERTTSRLQSVTDEKGQTTVYDYFSDDTSHQIRYQNALVPTPTVTFSYDINYNRVKTMEDGIGLTTYQYHSAGALGALHVASVDGPWNNDTITFQHDPVGRVIRRAINGVELTMAYDEAGRTTNIVNLLGSFRYAYDGSTRRLLDVFYPNGQSSHYDYFDSAQDHRLQRITHRTSNASLLSRFTYAYSPHGTLTNWLQELGGYTEAWAAGYDDADQLTNIAATTSTGTTNTIYVYDKTGNRLVEQVGGDRREFNYNALNELTSSSDASTSTITYQWDAEQRLTAIIAGNSRTEFSYDGLGRRCRIVEMINGGLLAERRFIWCGFSPCEERNHSDVAINRFFGEGEQQSGQSLFYTRDHLRSVREMSDSRSNIRARYRYLSFGIAHRLQGDLQATFGFTGHFNHSQSSNVMTFSRVYDPRLARWLSRDQIGENGGVNLYAYVMNRPLDSIDPLGFDCKEDLLENLEDALKSPEDYAYDRKKDRFPKDSYKCNKFVQDMLDSVGIPLPKSPGGWPPTAGNLANPKANIPNCPIVTEPQPGDIVASKGDFSDASGHTGIVKDDDSFIGAGNEGVKEEPLTKFDKPPYHGPVYRRCGCPKK